MLYVGIVALPKCEIGVGNTYHGIDGVGRSRRIEMDMQGSMKHVPLLGGYGLCSLWEIKWYAREQFLFVLQYLIASNVFDEFCACTGWVDTIT